MIVNDGEEQDILEKERKYRLNELRMSKAFISHPFYKKKTDPMVCKFCSLKVAIKFLYWNGLFG